MKIGFYVGTLLYQNDCVIIPGFGGFIANYAPARIHPVLNTFIPPSRQIMFNACLLHNDGLLASHIATVEGIGFNQALNRIAEEVESIRASLYSGKSIILDGLGSLRSNPEHNIVFTPQIANNYLEDAFGLTTFVSPAIRRTGFQSNQDATAKSSSLHLPVAVRRIAAIAVPLLAVGMWSLFNTDKLSEFSSNYSSLFPTEIFAHFASGPTLKKSMPVNVTRHDHGVVAKPSIQPGSTKKTPLVTQLNTPSKPSITPSVTDKPQSSKISAPQPSLSEKKSTNKDHFLIISGAFKMKENAEKLLGQLKAQNFHAALAGQNKKGLYLVSVASCKDAHQADLKLKEVLNKGIEAAWILKN